MKTLWKLASALAMALVGALLLSTTAPKLFQMAQIKGWLPGGVFESVTITDLQEQISEGRAVYQVAWGGTDITQRGVQRSNLDQEQWRGLRVGDPLAIVRLPATGEVFVRDGIFVSGGNFAFDLVLLALELLAIVAFLRAAWAAVRGARRS